jgi:hypothetical protein
LSYARFGSFVGVSIDHYINPVHREFAHNYGMFSLQRVPYGLADYFGLRFPSLQWQAPFLKADRHFFAHPSFIPFRSAKRICPFCGARAGFWPERSLE